MTVKAISIMYHDVVGADGADDASGFAGADAAIYKIDRDSFEKHLEQIAKSLGERQVITCDQLRQQRNLDLPPLLITFDDGGVSAYTQAIDALEERGWRGHFFVAADRIGTPSFLSRGQLREMHARGHVIGSHSSSHPARMSHCTWDALLREWRGSVDVLSEIIGCEVDAASVPGGYYSRKVAEAAALAGIRTLFTSEPVTRSWRVDDCLVLGRYTIQRWTPPAAVAALVSGAVGPRLKQFLLWNAKKTVKTAGGKYYLKVRKSLLKSSATSR